jgi:hypothetical protein
MSFIKALPINIVFSSTGLIGFERLKNFPTVSDHPELGIQAIFDNEGICVGTTELQYGQLYNYREMPELLAYLQQQKLINPLTGE